MEIGVGAKMQNAELNKKSGTASEEMKSWKCPACNTVNQSSHLVCAGCPTVRANEGKHVWTCEKCTLANEGSVDKCSVCNTPRFATNLPDADDIMERAREIEQSLGRSYEQSDQSRKDQVSDLKMSIGSSNRKNCRTSSSSTAEREKHSMAVAVRLDEIVDFCKKTNTSYEDPEFAACTNSLYEPGVECPSWSDLVTCWRHPADCVWEEDDFHPQNQACIGNIKQGLLGNCWFATALAVLADKSHLLERVMIRGDDSVGVYAIRLCKDGCWTDVIVDDRLPCTADGRIAFCKGARNQVWVPMIEKALAKLHGNYAALTSGLPHEGLAVLTGHACESIELDSIQYGEQDSTELDTLWARLCSSFDSEFPVGCSCGSRTLSHDDFDSVDLVPNHAYSVLQVKFINGIRLLQLRNPWGHFTWSGEWSVNSNNWQHVSSEVKQHCLGEDDTGLFWISLDDWMKYFTAVYICYVHEDWQETRESGCFLLPGDSVWSVTRLSVEKNTEVDLSLHQITSRSLTASIPTTQLADVMLLVFDDQWNLKMNSKRQFRKHTHCTGVLQPGHYNVFCISFSYWLDAEALLSQLYTLVCHSRSLVRAESINLPADTIAEVITRLAVNKGSMTLCDSDGLIRLYSLNRGWAGQITVAENSHSSDYLHVKLDLSSSTNVTCIRGDITIDTVPPLCKQVLNIASFKDNNQPLGIRSHQSYHTSTRAASHRFLHNSHQPAISASMTSLLKPFRGV